MATKTLLSEEEYLAMSFGDRKTKAKGKVQKAKGKGKEAASSQLHFCALPFALCLLHCLKVVK